MFEKWVFLKIRDVLGMFLELEGSLLHLLFDLSKFNKMIISRLKIKTIVLNHKN